MNYKKIQKGTKVCSYLETIYIELGKRQGGGPSAVRMSLSARKEINMNIIAADYTLDCRGLSCPMPLLKTYKILATMTSGEILELWGTDAGTKNDIEIAMTKAGNEYLGFKDDEGFTRYFIKKG